MTYGPAPPPGHSKNQKKRDEKEEQKKQEEKSDEIPTPEFVKKVSKEDASEPEKEKIVLVEVTQRSKEIAAQLASAMKEQSFQMNIDFNVMQAFLLEVVSSLLVSTSKDIATEEKLIC